MLFGLILNSPYLQLCTQKISIKGRINYENALKQARFREPIVSRLAYSALAICMLKLGFIMIKNDNILQKEYRYQRKSPKGEVKNFGGVYEHWMDLHIDLKEPDKAYPYLIKTKQLAQS